MNKYSSLQDLHIHTIFSEGDTSVALQQTISLINQIKHARIIGISDHFHLIQDIEVYFEAVRSYGFKAGTEVSNLEDAKRAVGENFDYFIFHCRNETNYYKAVDLLLQSNRPLIIAHPCSLGTNLDLIPHEAIIEINNRYVWKYDWKEYYSPFLDKFKFVIGSDAHQPHWLNLNIAKFVMNELKVKEKIIFE